MKFKSELYYHPKVMFLSHRNKTKEDNDKDVQSKYGFDPRPDSIMFPNDPDNELFQLLTAYTTLDVLDRNRDKMSEEGKRGYEETLKIIEELQRKHPEFKVDVTTMTVD